MLQARDLIGHQILWNPRNGLASVWHDNSTGLGDLYTITRDYFSWDITYKTIDKLTRNDEWDTEVIDEVLPKDSVIHILQDIRPPTSERRTEKPYCMFETRGEFTIKSAWHYIIHKEDDNTIYKWIWTNDVPFKMAFIMSRVWKFKILVDDELMRWGLEGPSKCWCCDKPQQETLAHAFLKSNSANRTWSYFCYFAGLNMDGLQLREVIMLLWGTDIGSNMSHFIKQYQVL